MGLRSVQTILSLMAVAAIACSAQQSNPQQFGSNYGQLPLTFEANHGQTDARVKFLSRGKGYIAFLTTGGMVLSLRPTDILGDPHTGNLRAIKPQSPATTLEFRLVGVSQTSVVVGEEPQPGRVNYFVGNNPAKWHTNVPTYARVRCKNVYPGIDLVYHGNHRQLEYDFEISPNADPNRIQFEIKGARHIQVDGDGDLLLDMADGKLRFKSPTVYQGSKSQRAAVGGQYVVLDSTHIAFQVALYDQNKSLVIDPVLIYSTYLGGSGNDEPRGIAVDGAGNSYIAGFTDSADFPLATMGSLPVGSTHVFVAKLDASGSNLVYAAYLGGNSQDYGYALALDNANDVYVAGSTASSDFPLVNPFQGTYPGAFNAFLTKISPDGSSLLYSTYLGGNGSDIPSSVAVDGAGDMVVGGNTSSTNFPVVNAYQSTASANQGGMFGSYGFMTKFSRDGASLVYSTYLGGNSNVPLNCGGTPCWPQPFSTISGMVVDTAGNAYAAGTTNTYNFPVTSGAYLTTDSTQLDGLVGFVSKFDGTGSLQYSTYFYESSGLLTNITAIAVDGSSSAYVTGTAFSDGTFPLTSTSICDPAVYGWGCSFGFITKFDASGSTLLYSTFLGPNNYSTPTSVLLDAGDNAYVLASTSSGSFGTVNGIQSFSGVNDILLVKVDPIGTSEVWATYLGGSLDDFAAGIASDANDNLYVIGSTTSRDFPTTAGAFQATPGGNTDAFVLKIGPTSAPAVALSPATLQFTPQTVGGTSGPQAILLRNMGDAPLSIASNTVYGDFSETNDCGTSVAAAGSCRLSVTFTPTAEGQRSGAVIIQDDAAGSPHIVNMDGDGLAAIVNLTPSSLSFAATQVGTSSVPQMVTLANNGNATLNVGNIQVTGDYTQANNCPGVLEFGSSCMINVTFAPTVSGNRTGTLAISDSAHSSPHVAGLAGIGSDFSLSSSASSASVKAGTTATYTLTVAPVGGAFPNAIKLSCGMAPVLATCNFLPTSVTPSSNPATVTLMIHTTAPHGELASLRPAQTQPLYAVWMEFQAIGLFGIVLTGSPRWRKKISILIVLAVLIAPILFMSSCASDSGIARRPQPGTTPGTYAITVSGTSGALQHSLPLELVVQ